MAIKKRKGYFDSEEGKAMRRNFERMISDNAYHTVLSYSANIKLMARVR